MQNLSSFKNFEELVTFLNQPFQKQPTRLPNKLAESLTLTLHQKKVLAGTLLGDGSLKKPEGSFTNSRFQMKHSVKQFEWIRWKGLQLWSISGKKPFSYQKEIGPPIIDINTGQKAMNSQFYSKLHFKTRALSCLTAFQQELSTNNQLDFSKPWLYKYLDEEALMVWWLDDGGKQGTGNRTGKLSTHGFPTDQLPYLQNVLLDKWGIQSTIQSSKVYTNTYFYLQLSPNNLKLLLLRIMRHIPVGSMLYKAILEYKDFESQQDWICTMFKEVKPELHDDLAKLIGPPPEGWLEKFK